MYCVSLVINHLQGPGTLPVMLVGTVVCHVASGHCLNAPQSYDKYFSSVTE
jgi:hypothetical protein